MNISTYESRIKALEDQLNPPAPPVDPRTGIQSIVITPDVAGCNAKLAAIMPIAPVAYDPEAENLEFTDLNNDVDPNTEYIITVTPGTDYYAFGGEFEEPPIVQKGEPFTIRKSGRDDIDVTVYASDVAPTAWPPTKLSVLKMLIGKFQ